jgi:hypothetical protein
MLPASQAKAWQYLRDGWAKLERENPPPKDAKIVGDRPSFEGVIAKGGPRVLVEKWANDKARWVDYGIPWKFTFSPQATLAAKAAFGVKENWELAAIDELEPTDLDTFLNELQGVQNAIRKKAGLPEDKPRYVAPVSYGGPLVQASQATVDVVAQTPLNVALAPGSGKGAPKAGNDLGAVLKYLTPTNIAIAAAVTAGVVVLGPALGATLGSYASSRSRGT